MSLLEKLGTSDQFVQHFRDRRLELVELLDLEINYHIDKKERVPELRIREHIKLIDGFLMGIDYCNSKYEVLEKHYQAGDLL